MSNHIFSIPFGLKGGPCTGIGVAGMNIGGSLQAFGVAKALTLEEKALLCTILPKNQMARLMSIFMTKLKIFYLTF